MANLPSAPPNPFHHLDVEMTDDEQDRLALVAERSRLTPAEVVRKLVHREALAFGAAPPSDAERHEATRPCDGCGATIDLTVHRSSDGRTTVLYAQPHIGLVAENNASGLLILSVTCSSNCRDRALARRTSPPTNQDRTALPNTPRPRLLADAGARALRDAMIPAPPTLPPSTCPCGWMLPDTIVRCGSPNDLNDVHDPERTHIIGCNMTGSGALPHSTFDVIAHCPQCCRVIRLTQHAVDSGTRAQLDEFLQPNEDEAYVGHDLSSIPKDSRPS